MSNSNTKSNILFNKAQLEYLREAYKSILGPAISPKLSDRDIMYRAGISEVISHIATRTPEERTTNVRVL